MIIFSKRLLLVLIAMCWIALPPAVQAQSTQKIAGLVVRARIVQYYLSRPAPQLQTLKAGFGITVTGEALNRIEATHVTQSIWAQCFKNPQPAAPVASSVDLANMNAYLFTRVFLPD